VGWKREEREENEWPFSPRLDIIKRKRQVKRKEDAAKTAGFLCILTTVSLVVFVSYLET
jgi:hypothetical protein